MTSNNLIQTPVRLVVYDPIQNANRRTFVFLGDAPKSVCVAASNYADSTGRDKQQYDKTLREFYGQDYKNKLALTGQEQLFVDWREEKLGNDEPPRRRRIGADDDDLADIEELLKEEPAPARGHPRIKSLMATPEELKVRFAPGVEYVRDVHIYPEDKFNEFKEKIYLATGIPAYRQHLFYVSNNRLYNMYKLWAEGLYNVDIRKLAQSKDNVLGVPIDKTLYDIRSEIRVEALDMFRVVGGAANANTVFYVVDLAQFTQRLHNQLLEIINDTYQFELFYYGFIIKYFPQLTKECFYDFVVSEPELQHKYPDLAKPKQALEHIYRAEQEIIDYDYKHIAKALKWAECIGVSIAITQMTATMTANRVMLNIRNLFDKLHVSRCIPEIHAYIEHGGKKYLLRKRHVKNATDIQFPSGNLMKAGLTLAISLRKSDQDTFHSRSSISTMENEQSRYMFLNIWPNGRYHIRTIWNEEDELNFDEIIKIMKRFTDPIISGINKLGRYVFINGTELPLLNKTSVTYQGLNVCIFWKKVMLESTFKLVKSLWDIYMKARITGPRNVQQYDRFEFIFRKGMYEFDISAIERIVTASNNIVLSNYYAHLSNNAIKQKWDQNYDGRIVRMSHRTTAVRFEVTDIREKEFALFYRYIIMFIYRAAHDDKIKQSMIVTKNYGDDRRLRKLREQDPELFNLKKHGSKKVYSILCQKQRQPLIYTPDEVKNMSAKELKELTLYWNFTMNKPAYYGCPNKKYPHLSFTVDAHPKHYCLPCCSKAQSNEESKKNRVTAICLTKHRHPLAESLIEGTTSRHIMNYGKDIDLGRLSKLPNSAIRQLLFDTLPQGNLGYYLYGVAQHVPAVNHIGLLYAAAEALEMSMEQLIKEIITGLKKAPDLFNVLINGTLIEHFRNNEDLTITIKELFLDNKMVSREAQKFKAWPELFTEILHAIFKVSIFTFIDEAGNGTGLDLYVPDLIRSEINYMLSMGTSDDGPGANIIAEQRYLLLIKKQNRCYPLFVIDADQYFKNFAIEKRVYDYGDQVIKLIFDMISFEESNNKVNIDQPINLSVMEEFVATTKYEIRAKFINKGNLCYALLLNGPGGAVYVPINYSVYIADGVPLRFDALDRAKTKLPWAALDAFVKEFNDFIKSKYRIGTTGELYAYKRITIEERVNLNGAPIGFRSGGMIYYCNNMPANKGPAVNLNYDPTVINDLILKRTPPAEDNRHKKLGESLYNNYIYQIFVIEFINYLDKERNDDVRRRIRELITTTNFKKDVTAFTAEIKELLKDYPADYDHLQDQLIAFYYSHFNKVALLNDIDNTVYDFDRVTMNKLKKMDRPQMMLELKNIAKTFTEQREFDTTGIQFPNIYLPCSEMTASGQDTGYCEGRKLLINRPLDELVDILATDIMDDLKVKYLMTALFSDTTLNFFHFQRVPTEIITIYRLTE